MLCLWTGIIKEMKINLNDQRFLGKMVRSAYAIYIHQYIIMNHYRCKGKASFVQGRAIGWENFLFDVLWMHGSFHIASPFYHNVKDPQSCGCQWLSQKEKQL